MRRLQLKALACRRISFSRSSNDRRRLRRAGHDGLAGHIRLLHTSRRQRCKPLRSGYSLIRTANLESYHSDAQRRPTNLALYLDQPAKFIKLAASNSCTSLRKLMVSFNESNELSWSTTLTLEYVDSDRLVGGWRRY